MRKEVSHWPLPSPCWGRLLPPSLLTVTLGGAVVVVVSEGELLLLGVPQISLQVGQYLVAAVLRETTTTP